MNTTSKFLIIVAVSVLLGGAYVYFSYGGNAQAATAGNSSITSTTNSLSPAVTATTAKDEKINSDTAFLVSLISLTKIKIDTTLFDNDAFDALVDNNVKLEPTPYGRTNPFAPLTKVTPTIGVTVSPLTTNPPIQITDKTASLYGTANNPTTVSNVYFEYGPTPTLGKKTPNASLSLVGTFVSNISGLTPKTAYFYRAVAKVGDTLVYGDTVSFFTN